MPYVRKNKSTRKRSRTYQRVRKGKYGRGNTWASNAPALARTALKTAKWVASIVNTEFKFFDVTQVSFLDVTNSGYTLVPLGLIAQGDDTNQRNGRSIKCMSSDMRFKLQLNGTTDNAVIRVLMFIDWAQDGSAPVMSDIYDTVTGDDAITSFRNILTGTSKRYGIIWNKTYSMDKDFKSQIYHNVYRKLGHHIKYVGTGGSAADAGQGMLYLAFIGTGVTPNNC